MQLCISWCENQLVIADCLSDNTRAEIDKNKNPALSYLHKLCSSFKQTFLLPRYAPHGSVSTLSGWLISSSAFPRQGHPSTPLFPLPLALFGRLGAELRILVSHYININIMRQGVEQLPTILEMEINKFQKWTDDVPFHSVSSFSPSLSKSLSHSTVEVECRCKINVITQ